MHQSLVEYIISILFKQFSVLEWEEKQRKHIRTMPIIQFKAMVESMQIKFGKFCCNSSSNYKLSKSEVIISQNI